MCRYLLCVPVFGGCCSDVVHKQSSPGQDDGQWRDIKQRVHIIQPTDDFREALIREQVR